MKLLIAGSRTISDTDFDVLESTMINYCFKPTIIISGGAVGADRLGERYARKHCIRLETYIPDWEKDGKQAGAKRNLEMVKMCDRALIMWDGKSKGSQITINELKRLKKPMLLLTLDKKLKVGAKGDERNNGDGSHTNSEKNIDVIESPRKSNKLEAKK
jgi:hypothetical protein